MLDDFVGFVLKSILSKVMEMVAGLPAFDGEEVTVVDPFSDVPPGSIALCAFTTEEIVYPLRRDVDSDRVVVAGLFGDSCSDPKCSGELGVEFEAPVGITATGNKSDQDKEKCVSKIMFHGGIISQNRESIVAGIWDQSRVDRDRVVFWGGCYECGRIL